MAPTEPGTNIVQLSIEQLSEVLREATFNTTIVDHDLTVEDEFKNKTKEEQEAASQNRLISNFIEGLLTAQAESEGQTK